MTNQVLAPRKFDRARRGAFLEALRERGVVSVAAAEAGISRAQAYRAREKSPAFRAAWRAALEEALDLLESEARRRALEGWDKPVFYQGKQIGVVREYSDQLLMFLLQAYRPAKFRERVSGNEEVPTIRIVQFGGERVPENAMPAE